MSLASSCIAGCAPFTLISAILLFMMAHMLRSGNWTFMVLAAKHGWDRETKAATCQRGGLMYLFISLTLWVLLVLQAPVQRLWQRLPWVRGYEDDLTSRAALLGGETADADNGGYRYSPNHALLTRSRRADAGAGGGGARRQLDDATEMSAMEWAEQALGTSGAVSAPACPLGPALGTNTTGSPISRRFPDFQLSLAETAGKQRDGAGKVNGATASPTGRDGGVGSWNPSRGSRTRGGAANGHDVGLNSIVFQSSTPTTAAEAPVDDTRDDADFMSDVEVDGARHYTSSQLRVSGWGMHRTTQASAAPDSSAGGRMRASVNGHGSSAGAEGSRAARRSRRSRHRHGGGAHRASASLPPAAVAPRGGAAVAAAAAPLSGILTSLWPVNNGTSSTAASGAGRRRREAGSPLEADASTNSSDADSAKSKRV